MKQPMGLLSCSSSFFSCLRVLHNACSGEKFEWSNFQAPAKCSKEGWLLAGGLTPRNVGVAVSLVRPSAVDVSSGIAGTDGIRKDPALIQAFMDAIHNSSLTNLPHQQIVH
jgi:phosphoribosylanthranilate isomerase